MLHRILGILLLAASFFAAWVWMVYDDFVTSPLPIPESGLVYEVPPGASVRRVAADLTEAGVLGDPRPFRWYARWHDQAHRIKAGEYRLEAGLTGPRLLAVFTAGRTVSYGLTLVEGWNFRQVRAAVAANDVLVRTLADLTDEELMARLGYPGEHPEGRFFPDTYLFPRGTTDVEFLQRAYRRMQRELEALWPERAPDLPLASPYEALILASIIEKETGVPEERGMIAGVFTRRLRLGMKLQTDPTVIYGMGERYDGNIRKADLREDTPYNTYVHTGLTPTPICMPGRAALEAALHPEDTGAVYFVARGDGSHKFSETLKEHNAAVRKYQLGLND
jgi:UPF0755 protein